MSQHIEQAMVGIGRYMVLSIVIAGLLIAKTSVEMALPQR